MRYISTRGGDARTSAQAIVRGIAPDGGLYVPETLPVLSRDRILDLAEKDYPSRAAEILSELLPDFGYEELLGMTREAYSRFEGDFPCPAVDLENTGVRVLELFHGPTMAFKDMALQMLPHLMRAAALKTGETREIAVLTATSGDTGKAALEGFRDREGTSVTVFYPKGGVSRIQETQMVTSEGANTHVIAVRGNFDDAQTGVKKLFCDPAFISRMAERGRVLSSANSINLGRLAPQVAYYFSAAADMMKEGLADTDRPVDVCVPTGNFGNILACWYARRMGAPIGRLICASNANRVLTDFISTGVYDRHREFVKTISPSMDILISSNLERFLWEIGGAEKVRGWMRALSEEGMFTLDDREKEILGGVFLCGCADDAETRAEIGRVWEADGYVMDPHTAVASATARKLTGKTGDRVLLVATASPFKFGPDVCEALGIGNEETRDAFRAAEALERIGLRVPAPFEKLKTLPVRHRAECERDGMGEAVISALEGAKD